MQPPLNPLPPDAGATFHAFLMQELDALVLDAGAALLAAGGQLWLGLAVILIVWTGARMALSGTFAAWDVIQLVFALAIPRAMLDWYTAPMPGTALTFPAIVIGMGQWIHGLLAADIVTDMTATIVDRVHVMVERTDLTGAQGFESVSIRDLVLNFWWFVDAVIDYVFASALVGLLHLGFAGLFFVTYAQLIWAQFALGVAVLLGPVFIPFLMTPPLAFLFWGWLRTVLVYSLYAAVAGAVMRVFVSIGMRFLDRVVLDAATDSSLAAWATGLFLALPLIVAGLLAAFKCGELATMLVQGGGAVGSGLGQAVSAGTRLRLRGSGAS